jgi:hypothetical protein
VDHSSIGLIILGSPFVALLIGLISRRLYWTEWVQAHVLRWTGESRLCATAWGHTISPRKPATPRRVAGAPAGTSPGIRRLPAGVPAPAAFRRHGAAGLNVRPAAPPQPGVGPDTAALSSRQGGPQLTAATGDTPSPVAAVHQHGGARW